MFPDASAVLSPAGQHVLSKWAEHTILVTKSVEYAHRINNSHARAKGPSKPVDARFVADAYVISRFSTCYNKAMQRPASARPHLRQHPKVQRAMTLTGLDI